MIENEQLAQKLELRTQQFKNMVSLLRSAENMLSGQKMETLEKWRVAYLRDLEQIKLEFQDHD